MNVSDLRWAFFSYGHNLGDFTRASVVAHGMQEAGAIVKFYNHGSIYLDKIKNLNLDCEVLEPELTWEQHEVIMDINRYNAPVGTEIPVSEEQWHKMVEADLNAFHDFKPQGVFAGLSLSTLIAAQVAKIPYVTLIPTVNCPSFIEKGMYNFPNTMEKNFITRYIIPNWVKRSLMKRILTGTVAGKSLRTYNVVRERYGLKPIYNIVDLVKGDITLLPDLPQLSGLAEEDLTKGYHYTAPIFAKLDGFVPEEVKEVFSQGGLNVFCSLGSSGFPETLKVIVSALRKIQNINIVCATTTILRPEELGERNSRFIALPYVPAHLVNKMADIAVIHGGQGTVQTAVWSGTPVIGVGFQAEQQANLDGIAKAGMAIRIPIFEVNERRIHKAFKKIQLPIYKICALRMQRLIHENNGIELTVEKMNEFLIAQMQK